MKKKLLLILIFLTLFCFRATNIEASNASLYLSPNNRTFNIGSTFDVSIFINTGEENINVVKADLKFNPKKIQIANPTLGKSFISIWAVPPSFSNSEGYISFQGGVPSPGIKTSSGLISTITFRAINPGKTTIYLADTSQALLNDGNGTNILNSYGKGIYNIIILPPEGPNIFSLTHSDQNKWHKDNNPTFLWEKEDGISEFSYSISKDPFVIPDNQAEGAEASVSYSNLEDGSWYFHIKAKKGEIWGGTSHFLIRIDKGQPASFTIKISPAAKTSSKQPIISFFTTDAFSGMDHFEIKAVDITIENNGKDAFFIEANSPYIFSNLEIGTYMIIVRDYDKAGNWQDENIKLEIIPDNIKITEKGLWYEGKFSSWWPFLLVALIIMIMIIIIVIICYKKDKKFKAKVAQKLREREKEIEKINLL